MQLTLAKNLLRKESKLPIWLEQFFNLQLLKKLGLIVIGSCNSSVTSASCEIYFSKMKLVKIFSRNSMTSERLGKTDLLSRERYELKNRFSWFC